MGFFDNLLGGLSDIGLGGICNDGPICSDRKILKESRKSRKSVEETAERINPALGKAVKGLHNVEDTLENAEDSLSLKNVLSRVLLPEVKNIDRGDHLFVQRAGYTHHGLYVGDGRVIHYIANGIGEDDLETFADGAKINRKSDEESPRLYPRDEVVSRARRRSGEDTYNLMINNCEHFVRWCRSGTEY